MLSWVIADAVRYRLQGESPTFVPPRPHPNELASGQQGRYQPREQATVDAQMREPYVLRFAGVAVPIHPFDLDGVSQPRAHPSITYKVGPPKPRYEEALFNANITGDSYFEEVGEPRLITFEDGEQLLVPRIVRRRRIEHPMDVSVEIRVYSRDPGLASYLQSWVYRRFPPRSFIRVRRADDSEVTFDMLHTETTDLDSREATLSGFIDREFATSFTYNVEAYEDLTDEWQLAVPVRETINR